MKKQIITKVLSAFVIMAVSLFIVNIQAQDVTVSFLMDPEGAGVGDNTTGGIGGGRPGPDDGSFVEAEDPRVELNFSIGPTGQISLDASTPSTVQAVIDAIDNWDNTAIGATTNADLFGKSFQLVIRGESRMQLGYAGGHGIGIRGRNQGRLDDEGDLTEWLDVTLGGDVGIDFVQFGFTEINGPAPNAVIVDYDTEARWDLTDPDPFFLNTTDYSMRYFSDKIRFTTDSSANNGYRVYSLAFNVVVADPKPPAVVETTPAHADTTVETTTDYMIQFDIPVDQTSAESAITFTPDVPNRVDAWNDTGDELTISFDELPYSTEYVVSITTALTGTNDLNMLADTTFTFKTLPEPPTVIYTFPANIAQNVPVTTPFELRFSKGMIPDSVEKAIEFTPVVSGLDFIWSSDNSIAYFNTEELSGSTQYFVTVGTVATDRFGVQLAQPYQFVFTTATPVSVDNRSSSDMVIYPNPADEIISIRGIDVKSVRIYSIAGQVVKEQSDRTLLDVGDVKPGSYVIVVKDRNDKQYQELIIIQ